MLIKPTESYQNWAMQYSMFNSKHYSKLRKYMYADK